MKTHFIVIIGVVALLAGFFGGIEYAKSTQPAVDQNAALAGRGPGGAGARAGRGGQGMGGFTTGKIIAQDATSITVQLRDGSSKIVLIAGSTEYSKMVAGTIADMVIGKQVSVSGTANSDGSITAQTIQLRPDMVAVPGAAATSTKK